LVNSDIHKFAALITEKLNRNWK